LRGDARTREAGETDRVPRERVGGGGRLGGPELPRSKSTRTIGARRTTRPALAGSAMYAARRSEKTRVSATARVSPAAACRAVTGNEADASAIPKTPRGNSMTRSA